MRIFLYILCPAAFVGLIVFLAKPENREPLNPTVTLLETHERLTLMLQRFGLARPFIEQAVASDTTPGDLAFVDQFIVRWRELVKRWVRNPAADYQVAEINRDVTRFNVELARALRSDFRSAFPRLLLYLVVQIGGFLPLDSPVGIALDASLPKDAVRAVVVEGKRHYFAGHLYFWWEEELDRFVPYAPLKEWRVSDFAMQTVVPTYRRLVADGTGLR